MDNNNIKKKNWGILTIITSYSEIITSYYENIISYSENIFSHFINITSDSIKYRKNHIVLPSFFFI